MVHRIFLGLKISRKLATTLFSLRAQFNTLPLRPTPVENMHLTIIPPWQTEQLDAEIQKINMITRLPKPFDLLCTSLGFGPTLHNPRLLWAYCQHDQSLTQLKSILEKSLEKEEKYNKFVPHITLGRLAGQPDPQTRTKFPYTVNLTDEIQTFTLFESHLSPKGAHYSVVEDFPLA